MQKNKQKTKQKQNQKPTVLQFIRKISQQLKYSIPKYSINWGSFSSFTM